MPRTPNSEEPEDEAQDKDADEGDIELDAEDEEEDVEDVDVAADDEEGDDEDEEDEEEESTAAPVAAPAPPPVVSRPQPGRPPSAREEPPPPFSTGERVILTQNTRPRTGTPIGPYAVGATGRVETVLSQTAIVRFDRAPDTKEVVAFVCLESVDEEAKARRAERDREAAKGTPA